MTTNTALTQDALNATGLTREDVLDASADRPWGARFDYLASLTSGWLGDGLADDGYGKAVATEALVVAHRILEHCAAQGQNLPSQFPMENGGVILEWASPSYVSNIEIVAGTSENGQSVVNLDLFDLAPTQSRTGTSTDDADVASLVSFLETLATRTR